MFTGIVEKMGGVRAIERGDDCATLRIEAGELAHGTKRGDSIAVNGCCLTVTEIAGDVLTFQAIAETLARTNLGELRARDVVNLERAMRMDQRLDGHIVQGHIDATGQVHAIERDGEDVRFHVECAPDFADLLVEKGSVAIDGVSLTVCAPHATGFHVALIPHTLAVTTLGRRGGGERVNLEADVLGKYVKRYLERVLPGTAGRGAA